MSVDRSDAERMAELARLSLDGQEMERLLEDLNRILDHVRVLQGIDAPEGPEPEVGHGPTRDPAADAPDALVHPLAAFAPELRDGFFVVPPPPGVHGEDEEP
jgi:aspartyl/glutamyl-tRNA(Asn/Gln) amidotransferase C subunit